MTGEEYKEGKTGMTREGKDGIVHDEDAFRQQDATRCRGAIERWQSTLVQTKT